MSQKKNQSLIYTHIHFWCHLNTEMSIVLFQALLIFLKTPFYCSLMLYAHIHADVYMIYMDWMLYAPSNHFQQG